MDELRSASDKKPVQRDFQSLAKKQGDQFANECRLAFECVGFEFQPAQTFKDLGLEVDATITNNPGISMLWEFKGSLTSKRAGLLRTDTVRKALCNAYLLRNSEYALIFPPLFLMTSHIPTKNAPFVMLDHALRHGVITDVIDSRNGDYLRWLLDATEDDIQALLTNHQQFGMTCHPHMDGVKVTTPPRAKAKAKKLSTHTQLTLVKYDR